MRSGNGLCAITDDECSVVVKPDPVVAMVVTKKPPLVGGVIATDMTGELTPHGSECGDRVSRSNSIAELTPTWTLSALQRLSVEEQTTLGRKLGGAGPVARNKSGTSPEPTADSPFRVVLQNAVVQGDLEAAAAALKSGADPNERDDLRHSSLHFAASRGDVRCLRKLMRSGARANVANNVRNLSGIQRKIEVVVRGRGGGYSHIATVGVGVVMSVRVFYFALALCWFAVASPLATRTKGHVSSVSFFFTSFELRF